MKRVHSDTGPFAIIPAWVLEQDIGPIAIRLYCQLALMADRNDGTSYPSRDYLSKQCHCSVRSIADALKELVRVGALIAEQRRKGDTDELDTNKYTVIRRHPGVIPALPQAENRPTPQAENNLVTRGTLNHSSASLDHSGNDLTQPLPLAAFKEAVLDYLSADAKSRVSRLVDIGDSLGYKRDGGFAAALTRDFDHGMKVVNAMVEGVTARGDPWAYVRKALDGQARKSAWSGQGSARPGERTGEGLVTVSREEVEAALKAKADEAARAGAGPDTGQGASGLLPGPEAP